MNLTLEEFIAHITNLASNKKLPEYTFVGLVEGLKVRVFGSSYVISRYQVEGLDVTPTTVLRGKSCMVHHLESPIELMKDAEVCE